MTMRKSRLLKALLRSSAFFCVSFILILFTHCGKTGGETDSSAEDSTQVASSDTLSDVSSGPVEDYVEELSAPPLPDLSNLVEYDGATQDSVWSSLTVYRPFDDVQQLARAVMKIKDSLATVVDQKKLSSSDSALFRPLEMEAHRAILEYQRMMRSPRRLTSFPGLFALTRSANVTDSGANFFPPPKPSFLFDQQKAFFLGGAPFLNKLSPEDGATFTGADGKPELRFESTHTENGNVIFNFLAYTNSASCSVTFGPPLETYYFEPIEVNGIGSLIHTFNTPISVSFITEKGIVPAKLISVTFKLLPQHLGCISNQPQIIFGCSQNVDQNDILGVYLSAASVPLKLGEIKRGSRNWTADLNADGIVDLIALNGSRLGEGSGSTLYEVVWYVNINGEWMILDWATDFDCT
jgi:hypothetical protein